jgi:hypothetical protein
MHAHPVPIRHLTQVVPLHDEVKQIHLFFLTGMTGFQTINKPQHFIYLQFIIDDWTGQRRIQASSAMCSDLY